MKILDVTEFYSERGGGVRSHLALKSQVLCRLGHHHIVVAPGAQDAEEPPSHAERLAQAGDVARPAGSARVIRIGGPASPYDPSYHLLVRFDKIATIVKRVKPDVLEIHSPYLAALGSLRARSSDFGVRTFQWHSDFIDTYAGVLEARVGRDLSSNATRGIARGIRGGTRPLWGMVRAISKRCDATLVAARWQVDKLTSHHVPRVRRVPFGIEREIFRPEVRTDDSRRELLALGARTPVDASTIILVGVGRFAIEKRWDIVIDAFLKVRASTPARPMRLVLLGDGPERTRMTARASGSPDIVMPGFIKDRRALARTLASADALVHGCPFETFGLSIAEAMSCGLPAVVPDAGGAAEMHAPGAGEQYRALDVDACVAATERLLERITRDASTVRDAVSRAVSHLPNVQQQFEGQVALYEDLLRSKRLGLC